jgi:hypothetical protein
MYGFRGLFCALLLLAPAHAFADNPFELPKPQEEDIRPFASDHSETMAPPQTERLMHQNVADLPPFPHDEQWLYDPCKWPKSQEFSGRKGTLSGNGAGADKHALCDEPRKKPRGYALTLRYNDAGDGRWPIGPEISWYLNERLSSKTWWESHHNGAYWSYYYDLAGRLRLYVHAWSKYASADSLQQLTENFDTEGRLVGAILGSRVATVWYYWRTIPVTEEEYRQKFAEWCAGEGSTDMLMR